MLTIASSHHNGRATSGHGVAGSFVAAIERLIVRWRFNSDAGSLREDAIAILRDDASTSDKRDWAERYLSGATSLDAAAYLEGRRCQS